ncbi:MAG: cyclophilin-like fold protein [Desulfobacterales bacterium]|nr:cyclophilin-like fold protein [Desulfobacterales bacterium]
MRQIRITSGNICQTALINENSTADAIWDALPLKARVNTWGDEIYFTIPVDLPPADDAGDVLEMGALGYWPPGKAFCIFFGRTPASTGDEIRAASAVNIFGKVQGDAKLFKEIRDGDTIILEPVSS